MYGCRDLIASLRLFIRPSPLKCGFFDCLIARLLRFVCLSLLFLVCVGIVSILSTLYPQHARHGRWMGWTLDFLSFFFFASFVVLVT